MYSGDLHKAQGCPAGRLEITDQGEAAFLQALPRQQPSWERPRMGEASQAKQHRNHHLYRTLLFENTAL